jgi:hypothetical protein
MAASTSPNWWKDLLSLWSPSGAAEGARPLRLAVRDGYLNFYLRGQSIARVGFNRSVGAFAHVHVNYAFAGSEDQTYAKLSGLDVIASKPERTTPYAGMATLRGWMAEAARWEKPEKTLVERLTADNPRIIDLEMGLPAHAARTSALRIDLVALEQASDGATIVFWEAKRVSDSRLRSSSNHPHVYSHQIVPYRDYLSDPVNRAAVITGYREACLIFATLAALAGPTCLAKLHPLVRGVASGEVGLQVDPTPRLVIFGTEAELANPAWLQRRDKLTDLGVPMVAVRSDAYRLPSATEMAGG